MRKRQNRIASEGSEKPEPRSPPSPLHSPALVCVLLAVATCFAYFAVADFGFVDYDDGDYVSANPHVQSGLKWQNVSWALTTGHASNWHPLTWLSHMLDYQLFGGNLGAHHLVSLGFHIANTLLLFLIWRRMTQAHWASALVAALFALHPLHVESVAWLSERKDVLSTLFLLLTLGCYAVYVQRGQRTQQPPPSPKPGGQSPKETRSSKSEPRTQPPHLDGNRSQFITGARYYVLSLGFFALGLMSKPMLVTTPFLLLLLDYWPLQRLVFAKRKEALRSAGRLLAEKAPFFALTVISSVITFLVQRKGGAVSTALTLEQRLGNALVAYLRYLWKLIWPENLAVLYPHPGNWPVWAVAGSAVVLVGIFAVAIWLGRSRPYLPVGWLWFFGGLIPVLGLVQVGIQSMADRYTYVPAIGIFVIAVWGGWDLARKFNWPAAGLGSCSALLLAACGLLTMRQVQFWRNTEVLFRRSVEVEPKNYLAYNNLGFYLANHGNPTEAMENYQKSIAINPEYEDALNNLGHALAGQGFPQRAIPYYERALRVRPNHVEVNNNLGNALSELGKIDEAIAHYQIALKNNPDHADAHNNLGIALAMKGKLDEAIVEFQQALRLKPDYASAHSNLGNAFAVQQKWSEAIHHYQECLRLKPDDAQAHNNLANVLAQQGKLDDAILHYTRALSLNPKNNPEAHFNLGMALARQGKRQEARTHFAEALRLKPGYLEAQKQLDALGAPPPQ
jgi:tetratricopeptide (TPR) repeat protein